MEALILCTLLGSPHFQTRHHADASLRAMGDAAIPMLTMHANSRDPEVARRVDAILAARRHEGITAILAAALPLPWLDSIPDDTPDRACLVGHYVELARNAAGCGGPGWPDFRLATHLYIVDQAAAGVPLPALKSLLARMQKRCEKWDGSGAPPVELPEKIAMPKESQ